MSPSLLSLVLSGVVLIVTSLYLVERWRRHGLAARIASKDSEIEKAKKETVEVAKSGEEKSASLVLQFESEVTRVNQEVRLQLTKAQELVDEEREDLRAEAVRIRGYYETELRKSQTEADAIVATTLNEISALRKYQTLRDAEAETSSQIHVALKEAAALRVDAEALLDAARTVAKEERSLASKKAQELRQQADQILDRATRSAARMVEDAHRNAEQIAGDAYTALRDKEKLEQAAKGIRNIIDGYSLFVMALMILKFSTW